LCDKPYINATHKTLHHV